ncbi:MAG: hypothetical protein BWZ06_00085 [Bacteroidetes bacterium ADurb.BinA261]|nr:MAG: hypothetical protein BWZ06_00085 [Bacteroidetes bacterium ADurb.BinA261]
MVLIQPVHILLAVETPVGDQFHLRIAQHVQVAQQHPYGLHVGDVSGQLPVIEREVGLLAENQEQVDLRQPVIVLVFPMAHLAEAFRVAGDRGGVICPVLILDPPPALQAEEGLLLLFGD